MTDPAHVGFDRWRAAWANVRPFLEDPDLPSSGLEAPESALFERARACVLSSWNLPHRWDYDGPVRAAALLIDLFLLDRYTTPAIPAAVLAYLDAVEETDGPTASTFARHVQRGALVLEQEMPDEVPAIARLHEYLAERMGIGEGISGADPPYWQAARLALNWRRSDFGGSFEEWLRRRGSAPPESQSEE